MNKSRVVVTALAALAWPLLFWVGGIDLDERGSDQAVALFLAMFFGSGAWVFLGWCRDNA
jgi:hypothetical protein